jgi:phosphoglycerate kinase
MTWKTISDLDIEGRRVFVRVDFNVPLTPARGVADSTRVRETLPTLRYAIQRGARVIVGAHLGRPRGRVHPELSLEPVAACLAEMLGQEVVLADEPVGDGARKVVSDLRQGGVAMLENLRFAPGEEANEEGFSRALGGYTDVFVNDAFAVAHRAHASTAGITKHVGPRGAGFLLDREARELGRLLGSVQAPFLAIVGGAHTSEKLALIEALIGRAQAILLGGAVANTFLLARGGQMGRSLCEDDRLAFARSLLAKAQDRDVDVLLPRDLVAAAGTRAASGRVVSAMHVPDQLAALDIGPETVRHYAERIARARTVFWTGPLGAYESDPFSTGTLAVARAVASTLGGFTVVAGRDTGAAVRRAGLTDRISHVSTGGTAALEMLQGKKLPALAALEYKESPRQS